MFQNIQKGLPEVPCFSLYGDKEDGTGHQETNQFLEGHRENVFSHLPLHSQLQVRAPFPMIPVGGIQMVHSAPESLSGLHHSSTRRLQTKCSEDKKAMTFDTCVHAKDASPHSSSRDILSCSSSSLQLTSEDTLTPVVREHEENIHKCTKAIASLKIAPEQAGFVGADHLARVSEPETLESPPRDFRHFSGPEPGQPLTYAAISRPDSHSEKEAHGMERTLIAPCSFNVKSTDVKPLSFHAKKEMRTDSQEGRDVLAERGSPD